MKKRIALACMIAALVTPAFAACGDKTSDETQTVLPPEEIVVPVAPPQNDPVGEEPEVTPPEEEQPNDPDDTTPAMAKYIITTTDNLNVRSGAGTNYSSLGTVEKNILMKHVDKTGTWYETRYLGRKAYIHANYAKIVVLEQGDEKTERIIEEGLNVLGTPYVYGATRLHDGKGNFISGFTEKKFDCSSLMQFMFYRGAGILLNMTTRTQISQGTEVTGELRRGDLMFFTNESRKNNTGIERVGHVALYLGGNYILHTASDYAKIEQISSTRWSYYLGSRRMF